MSATWTKMLQIHLLDGKWICEFIWYYGDQTLIDVVDDWRTTAVPGKRGQAYIFHRLENKFPNP